MTKFIFITGGVISSLGKGITSASLGLLLKSRGYSITIQKLDPYINVDAGTMNPFQHGEVFVTEDGAETDLDLGHYERFTGELLNKESNYTTGRIYEEVIRKERAGEYLGQTVQVIPHITNAIKKAMRYAARKNVDIGIIEIGGTVGDIESLPFLEAVRQMRLEHGRENTVFLHLTLVPYIRTAGELKTKPSQHSVGKLREIGIQPDFLVCRCSRPLNDSIISKLSLFCNVPETNVIEERDVEHSIYEVPIALAEKKLDDKIIERLGFQASKADLTEWKKRLGAITSAENTVKIGVVGKYIALADSYKSIYEALTHSGMAQNTRIEIRKVDSELLEKGDEAVRKQLGDLDGILVPGGFGARGIDGKLVAIRFARENGVPYFGICYGMQLAAVEFARNACGLKDANSSEIDKNTPYPVIHLMEEQEDVSEKGGTMRLGSYPCWVQNGTKGQEAYREAVVMERHRHRFEFNNEYRRKFSRKGMKFSGISPDKKLVEMVELKDHPWFVAVQFHPEFKSQVLKPHPLFSEFVRAASECKSRKCKEDA
ncbi:MAG: CTP synthase [Planctomycetota bacterium]|nr:CTP synthase [Planctomycetota bacterium]